MLVCGRVGPRAVVSQVFNPTASSERSETSEHSPSRNPKPLRVKILSHHHIPGSGQGLQSGAWEISKHLPSV